LDHGRDYVHRSFPNSAAFSGARFMLDTPSLAGSSQDVGLRAEERDSTEAP